MDNASIHHVLESAVQMTEDAGALVHFLPILQIWTQLRSFSKLKYFLIDRMTCEWPIYSHDRYALQQKIV